MSNNNDSGCGCVIIIIVIAAFAGLYNTICNFFSWAWHLLCDNWGWIVAIFVIICFIARQKSSSDQANALARDAAERQREEMARIDAERKREEMARIDAERKREEMARIDAERKRAEMARLEAERTRAERKRLEAERQHEKIEAERQRTNRDYNYNLALKEIHNNNFTHAFELLSQAAHHGHHEAQLLLGDYYSNAYQRQSSNQNSPCEICGSNNVLESKCTECGTPHMPSSFHAPVLNYELAFKWYLQAASGSLDRANYALCIARYFGLGVAKHYPSAKRFYDKIQNKTANFIYPPAQV